MNQLYYLAGGSPEHRAHFEVKSFECGLAEDIMFTV